MASGLEIVSLINGSIDVIKLTQGLYGAIKTSEGLPKAFAEVNKQLPLVQDTLTLAKGKVPYLDDATGASVKETLQQCGQNVQCLLEIFEALKDAEGRSIKKAYSRVVIHIGKRGRVEDLMKDTLSNIKRVAENQHFRLGDQIHGLQHAIENLSIMPPSIPDAEMEVMFGRSNFRQIGDSNTQNRNVGDTYNTTGGTVNTAGSGHFTQTYHNNYSSEETRWNAVVRWLQPQTQTFPRQWNTITSNDIKSAEYPFKTREGTGQWLLDGSSFQDWVKPNSSTKVLWLYGDAGYGKSVLCERAILALQKVLKESSGRYMQAAHHFYDYSDEPEAPDTVYRSLANSLFRQRYHPRDEVSDRIYSFVGAPDSLDMMEFIRAIVEELKTAYIFLDGLDEVLHHPARKQYAIDTLRFCLSLTTEKNADVKVWCSSQDRLKIRQTLELFQYRSNLPLTDKENATDIRMFILDAAERILGNDGTEEKRKSLLKIVATIKGNFLWAVFALDAIEDACEAGQLDEFVQNLPSNFEEYLKKKIRCIKPDSYKIFSQVLSCLVYAKRPLSFGELCEATSKRLYASPIKDKCSPFIRIEPVSDDVSQSICSVYHTSVRLFFKQNPDILQLGAPGQSNVNKDIYVSPQTLADVTLGYLRQERYRHLLRPQNTGALSTFMAGDSSESSADVINHHLLMYSAKNWAKHVDELYQWYKEVSPQSVDILWEKVDQFVRSKNFGTCLQVQSLFVQDRFSDWYLHKDRGHYCQRKVEDRNGRRYFIKSLPECYTRRGDGETLYKQYQEAMMEWAYFLRSESTLHGNFPGEISKCQWPSLGKSNFLHQIKSRLKSYRLENSDEDNIYSGTRGASSYFLGYGSDPRDLQVMFLKESRPRNGNTSHAKSRRKQTTTEMGQDKIQVDIQSWTTKKLGHRHKPQEKSPLGEFTSDDLRLYTQPLELKDHEVGRAARVAIAEDGGLIRVGPKIYIRDGVGDFKLLDLGYTRARYVEEACRSGPWVAMVHRRGVKLAESEDNHPGAPQTDHSDEEQSGSDSSSDSSQEDSPDEEVRIVMQSEPGFASVDVDRGWNSDSSNSARESPSSGSTTEVTDELPDDHFNDWFSEDEDMVLKDVDESFNESMDTASAIGSTLSQDADDETDPEGDTSSDISLKSTISRQMWGDSDSGTERSDDEPESFTMEEPSEERFSDCRQLVIFSFNPLTGQVHRRFRFVYRWAGRLFNSPPVIHPTYALAVWPLGRNEILFADLAGSPQVTYFTRSLRTGARDICHISIQAKFSDCGQFLHLVCLDGRRDGSSGQPHDGQTKAAEDLGRISQLYLRVSTYRLSKGKPARSPPRLVYKATVRLDCELLRKDGNCRLPASPLPYTITWTADHVYATESHRILRVYRLPLYRGVEERDLGQDVWRQASGEKRNSPDSDSEMDLDEPKPARVAFRNEKSIFLPNSASRRSVSFFPAPDIAVGTAKVDKEDIGRAKPSSKSHKQKSEGEKVVATIVISPEDSLINKEQLPYLGPPQVFYLTADEFGSWKWINEDDCGAGKDSAEAWSGGQLEARYERFDNEEDCDIVPYFR